MKIRLTESELQRVINESVSQILRENFNGECGTLEDDFDPAEREDDFVPEMEGGMKYYKVVSLPVDEIEVDDLDKIYQVIHYMSQWDYNEGYYNQYGEEAVSADPLEQLTDEDAYKVGEDENYVLFYEPNEDKMTLFKVEGRPEF